MGTQDRDYMREAKQREQPFTPPEPTSRSTLYQILCWLAIIYLCFQAFQWWESKRPDPPPQPIVLPQIAPTVIRHVERASPAERFQPGTTPRDTNAFAVARPRANETIVNRCVFNGRTTFSDTDCAPGASSHQYTVNGSRNMADGLPNAVNVLRTPSSAVVVSQSEIPSGPPEPALDPVARKSTCAWLDEAIRSIDSQARQPISAAEQDFLAAKRKKHRDEQFRLRC